MLVMLLLLYRQHCTLLLWGQNGRRSSRQADSSSGPDLSYDGTRACMRLMEVFMYVCIPG
jgi:hypothetical protein